MMYTRKVRGVAPEESPHYWPPSKVPLHTEGRRSKEVESDPESAGLGNEPAR